MRISIFTHVEHFKDGNKFLGYAPYIREMNIWLKYVEEVEVVAPAPWPPKGDLKVLEGYQQNNLTFTKAPSFNLLNSISTFKAVYNIPSIFIRIFRAMHRSDHLHLRSPGNLGLIACICQIFFPSKPKTAKYAGNWDPEALQPWSYKLQKWLLSNTFLTRNMAVLVYGHWPNQSRNVIPFFTASFSESEIVKIEKELSSPFKFLFVGNFVPGKQPQMAILIIEALKDKNLPVELHFYGDGVLKNELEMQAENKDYIHLHGNQPLEVLKQAYKDAHFVILASKSEGWPKAIAEGMFFGCIPIATGVSCVPWMLGGGSRGILIREVRVESGKRGVDSQDVIKKVDRGRKTEDSQDLFRETVERITELIKDPEEMRRMSMEAQEWSQDYTMEKFESEIRKFIIPKYARP